MLRGDVEPQRRGPAPHCASELAGYKVPKRFEFVSELPRTASGQADAQGAAMTDRERVDALARPPTSRPGRATTARRSATLFAEDAEYRYHPYDEPIRGREAIVESWLGEATATEASDTRRAEGTYDAAYRPVAVDGDVAVAVGTSTYTRRSGRPSCDDLLATAS